MTGEEILTTLDGMARKGYTAYSNNDYRGYDTARKEMQTFRGQYNDVLSRLERLSQSPAVQEVFGNIGGAASAGHLDNMIQAGIQSGTLKPMTGPNFNAFSRDPDKDASLDSLDERGLDGLLYSASRYGSALSERHADQHGVTPLSQLDNLARNLAATEAGTSLRSAYQLDARELSLGKLRDYSSIKDPTMYGDQDLSRKRISFLQEGEADAREPITARRFAEILRDPSQSPEVIEQMQTQFDNMSQVDKNKFMRTPMYKTYLSKVLRADALTLPGQIKVLPDGTIDRSNMAKTDVPIASRIKQILTLGAASPEDTRRLYATADESLGEADKMVLGAVGEGGWGAKGIQTIGNILGPVGGGWIARAIRAGGRKADETRSEVLLNWFVNPEGQEEARRTANTVLLASSKDLKDFQNTPPEKLLANLLRHSASLKVLDMTFKASGAKGANLSRLRNKALKNARLTELATAVNEGVIDIGVLPEFVAAEVRKITASSAGRSELPESEESAGQAPAKGGSVSADKWGKGEQI